jgi:hypothetical protein
LLQCPPSLHLALPSYHNLTSVESPPGPLNPPSIPPSHPSALPYFRLCLHRVSCVSCAPQAVKPQLGDAAGAGAPAAAGGVPKPDVVLASYEAYMNDAAALAAIQWETLLLDMRHR